MYLYLDPIYAKAGEGDFNGYMYKLMLLITIIIINYFFYSNKDNIVQ